MSANAIEMIKLEIERAVEEYLEEERLAQLINYDASIHPLSKINSED
jgi:hypothetical protein